MGMAPGLSKELLHSQFLSAKLKAASIQPWEILINPHMQCLLVGQETMDIPWADKMLWGSGGAGWKIVGDFQLFFAWKVWESQNLAGCQPTFHIISTCTSMCSYNGR